ncbi:hypothetical protein [Schaalia sp. lx-100]|uniref:hypothetical protein n=1 Tax=Schaalia sp. lx-100 TaxID=2899081 RepID=UPI001E5B27D8|nr:hypothetical protein [Schaalia sp. lx-100]MCD4557193.1 hypothetical protein [Schaalia sp. lx-100]
MHTHKINRVAEALEELAKALRETPTSQPEDAHTTEPETEPEPEPQEPPSLDEAKTVAIRVARASKKGRETVRNLLDEMGVSGVSDLAAEQIREFIERLNNA